jgi:hypothetical protein
MAGEERLLRDESDIDRKSHFVVVDGDALAVFASAALRDRRP